MREFLQALNDTLWGWPMLGLMLLCGLVCSLKSGLVQLRRFRLSLSVALGGILRRQTVGSGEVTPFQSLTTALAATVGTGNIVGVSVALAAGGPGAVFWMWAAALLGMATKYAEVVLALRYRQRDSRGDRVGGPMYYIRDGLGRPWRWLALLFSLFGALAALGIGNAVQAASMTDALGTALEVFLPGCSPRWLGWGVGVLAASGAALTILGGVRRLGRVTEKLIPLMAALYLLACLGVLIARAEALPAALGSIFRGAFRPCAVTGGAVGSCFLALGAGMRSGLFSNEAGLGSAPIAYAASAQTSPVRQGLYGIFEVFVDTVVMCSLTALTLLVSGVGIPYGNDAGSALNSMALATVYGPRAGALLIALSSAVFALATILSWSLYGLRCWEYLSGGRFRKLYQCVYVLACFFGAAMDPALVWAGAEVLNGLMAIPNLAALLALSGEVGSLTKAYFFPERQRSCGKACRKLL